MSNTVAPHASAVPGLLTRTHTFAAQVRPDALQGTVRMTELAEFVISKGRARKSGNECSTGVSGARPTRPDARRTRRYRHYYHSCRRYRRARQSRAGSRRSPSQPQHTSRAHTSQAHTSAHISSGTEGARGTPGWTTSLHTARSARLGSCAHVCSVACLNQLCVSLIELHSIAQFIQISQNLEKALIFTTD
jgi:hypothetical protein